MRTDVSIEDRLRILVVEKRWMNVSAWAEFRLRGYGFQGCTFEEYLKSSLDSPVIPRSRKGAWMEKEEMFMLCWHGCQYSLSALVGIQIVCTCGRNRSTRLKGKMKGEMLFSIKTPERSGNAQWRGS